MSQDYNENLKRNNTQRLRALLAELPDFLGEFFRGVWDNTSPRTRTAYAYDLKLFFSFLAESKKEFVGREISQLTIDDLQLITPDDIEMYMEYLTYYEKEENGETIKRSNDEKGKSRKLSSVRTLFSYFYKKRKISANPSELVDFPKIHERVITRLEINEVARLLDEVESGEHLTQTQQRYHRFNSKRDLAIVTLLLGTGIRVSECVGINISHIDFETSGIKITRKGGNETIIYFGDEVEKALRDYLEERQSITAVEGNEDALWLSLQRRRLTDRSIQMLVKKYSRLVTSLKKISPHKLRSTYGTNLYRETGDIYLVADVLGHTDVNTTRKHYAEVGDDQRRKAARFVKLREE